MIFPLVNRKNAKPAFQKLLFFVILLIVENSCTNPFAPNIDKNLGSQQGLISDQTNIEGVFQNFKYAYTFKDTLIYSKLLDKDFVFSYRDYDIGADISWGRDEEMKAGLNGLG